MGDAADYMIERLELEHLIMTDTSGFFKPKEYKPKWRTRNGDVIFVEDMSDGHLRNSINLIDRKLKDYELPFGEPDDFPSMHATEFYEQQGYLLKWKKILIQEQGKREENNAG